MITLEEDWQEGRPNEDYGESHNDADVPIWRTQADDMIERINDADSMDTLDAVMAEYQKHRAGFPDIAQNEIEQAANDRADVIAQLPEVEGDLL